MDSAVWSDGYLHTYGSLSCIVIAHLNHCHLLLPWLEQFCSCLEIRGGLGWCVTTQMAGINILLINKIISYFQSLFTTVLTYTKTHSVGGVFYIVFQKPFSNCHPCMVQSQGVSFLSISFAVTRCRKTRCPQSTTLMIACDGLPRCENNIRPAGQVAMPERRAWRLNNEGYAS